MNLGVIPEVALGGVQAPDADSNLNPGPSTHPIKNGNDPLAPKVGHPWQSDALLSFGAGLLSGRNFLDGLAKGATAAQDARHAYENPKRDMLDNGAFTFEQYPDGSTKLVPNNAVQDYNTGLAMNALMGKIAMAKLQGGIIADRMAANNDAQMQRTQAMIDSENKRAAESLGEETRYHTGQMSLEQQRIDKEESPYQKSLEAAQAKKDVELPDEINQSQEFGQELDQLIQLAQSGKIGLGPGIKQKGKRALSNVVPGAAPELGVDMDKHTQAAQIINHIKMIATRQWLKGMGGSRLTNYDLKLATTAQPNFEMTLPTFLSTVRRLKQINDFGVTQMQSKLEESKRKAAGQSSQTSDTGVTSGGIHWKIVGE